MNKVILMGRLTRDPEVRYTQGNEPMAIARYTLAVDRRGRKDGGEATADFIQCVAFRNNAEFAEKYLRQGRITAVRGLPAYWHGLPPPVRSSPAPAH